MAAPALAHELECIKEVNGEVLLEVSTFPTTLTYELTINNIHPTAPSDVLEASDDLLEDLGWTGFPTPLTIPIGGSESDTFSVTVDTLAECREIAELDGTEDDSIENEFTVRWDNGSDVCRAVVDCVPPSPPPPPGADGRRMTGGGSVFGTGQNRVTHGFQIRCDEDDPRQNLEVNWQGNSFHLLDMTSAVCSDNPALDEENPVAGFDTYVGAGTGRFNPAGGGNETEAATIQFTFTDDGEPGSDDTATIVVRDASGDVVLSVSGDLNFGNHQAHP